MNTLGLHQDMAAIQPSPLKCKVGTGAMWIECVFKWRPQVCWKVLTYTLILSPHHPHGPEDAEEQANTPDDVKRTHGRMTSKRHTTEPRT
jgi:hypothetical protein